MKKLVPVLAAVAAFVYRMVRLLTPAVPATGEMASGGAADPFVAAFVSLVTAAVVFAVVRGGFWLVDKIRKNQ